MCEKREKLIKEIAEAIKQADLEMERRQDLFHQDWDWQFEQRAEAALRVIERKADVTQDRILPCTCGHNGYGAHKEGCALYEQSRL